MQTEILTKVIERIEEGGRAALVFITEAKGSTPGAKNSMMAVFPDKTSFGTIGGGPVEYEVTKQALEAIEKGEDMTFEHKLIEKSDLNMVCGGTNKGYIKVFYPKARLLIFGAGHVGAKLARIAVRTNFDVSVIDPREDFKDREDFEGIKNFYTDIKKAKEEINFSNDDTYIVVCTPNSDLEVLENILNMPYKYLGMIGSRAKIKIVFDKLREKGVEDKTFDAIHSPVGLDIDDGSVEEIAISIMSEILAVKNGKYERVSHD
ncbi:XdhC/CoxI family protein [Anaerococcus sp. AGMB09787]|uniref:XdhC family protein n=1 Tax=Anaerococcus sp. AGMB09787 TaxID=2922869 RepID=UPI001FAE9BFB|nr:XdhC/CoxI family protein [Anaerococcus sp. AGMB09787]